MHNITENVRAIVAQIPSGCVMSYNQIAALSGNPGATKAVAKIVHNLSDEPTWRVVFQDGSLVSNYALGGAKAQRELLEDEFITFRENGKVNMLRHSYNR